MSVPSREELDHTGPVHRESGPLSPPLTSTDQDLIMDDAPLPRIFALIIAIDEYKHWSNLSGCVNDAEDFMEFLCSTLHVPASRIVALFNQDATYHAIRSSIRIHLLENDDIRKGDAIVFFFAGHGSRIAVERDWLADEDFVETLCPYDMTNPRKNKLQEVHDSPVYGLIDRVFDGLMRELAACKGDNITVILDSCFSGGMSRMDGVRGILDPIVFDPPVPVDFEREIWAWGLSERSAAAVVPIGFKYPAMASHVLLAACRQGEVAHEKRTSTGESRGAFTCALLDTARKYPLARVSYARLMELLGELQGQHPQCEGINKDRILFNASIVDDRSKSFRIVWKDGRCIVEAGSIHGIVVGTEFSVSFPQQLREETVSSPKDIRLIAREVDPLRCTVILHGSIDPRILSDSRAIVSKWNADVLNVYIQPPTGQLFRAVERGAFADVMVDHDDVNGCMVLQRFDPLMSKLGSLARVAITRGRKSSSRVLDAVAHFNLNLYRTNPHAPLKGRIKVELHRLKKNSNQIGPIWLPEGENYFGPTQMLDTEENTSYALEEVAEATINDMDAYYGLTIMNQSDIDLWPYVFYFDPSDYSVTDWYLPPSSAPLRRNSHIFLHSGTSGTDLIQFSIPSGRNSDTGFLKIFMATSWINMSGVKQPSVMEEEPRAAKITSPGLEGGLWDSWVYVITCLKTT